MKLDFLKFLIVWTDAFCNSENLSFLIAQISMTLTTLSTFFTFAQVLNMFRDI